METCRIKNKERWTRHPTTARPVIWTAIIINYTSKIKQMWKKYTVMRPAPVLLCLFLVLYKLITKENEDVMWRNTHQSLSDWVFFSCRESWMFSRVKIPSTRDQFLIKKKGLVMNRQSKTDVSIAEEWCGKAYLLRNCSKPCLRSSMKFSSNIPSSPRKGNCRNRAFPGRGGTTTWGLSK